MARADVLQVHCAQVRRYMVLVVLVVGFHGAGTQGLLDDISKPRAKEVV